MVVVHRAHGFRVIIYTQDREPAHVHSVGAEGRAKINLPEPNGHPEVVNVVDIKRSDMRRLLAEVTGYRDRFMREWERIHGRCD